MVIPAQVVDLHKCGKPKGGAVGTFGGPGSVSRWERKSTNGDRKQEPKSS
jgi:hypothetical protein